MRVMEKKQDGDDDERRFLFFRHRSRVGGDTEGD